MLPGTYLTETTECKVLWNTSVQPKLERKSFKEEPFVFVSKVCTKGWGTTAGRGDRGGAAVQLASHHCVFEVRSLDCRVVARALESYVFCKTHLYFILRAYSVILILRFVHLAFPSPFRELWATSTACTVGCCIVLAVIWFGLQRCSKIALLVFLIRNAALTGTVHMLPGAAATCLEAVHCDEPLPRTTSLYFVKGRCLAEFS